METSKHPPFIPFFITSIILAAIGWGGLYYVIFFTRPTIGPRWLFFFLALLAVTGIAIPIVYFLNRRFPSDPVADSGVVVRQALWVGIYADIIAWLQLGGVLNLALIVFIAVGLGLIEFFIRLRERARWDPLQGEANE